MNTIHVSFAGNPNSGKSTLFNNITGARQHVGNYPGVTVEKMVGYRNFGDFQLEITDLPGSYSLSAYSEDEKVTRDFLLEHFHPDKVGQQNGPAVVVNVLDASNLERNLYFTLQLKELGVPLVLALNMADIAEARGMKFDLAKLSELLGAPVVPTVGHKGEGINELLQKIVDVATQPKAENAKCDERVVDYGEALEADIAQLVERLPNQNWSPLFKRWMAIKILEKDLPCDFEFQPSVEDPNVAIASRRYDYISELAAQFITANPVNEGKALFSDKLDKLFLNRVLSLPIFLLMMYLVFQLTFTLGAIPMDWIEGGFEALGGWISSFWPEGSESILRDLLVDGIIGGVGGVLVFLPNILLLFLAISILEDSGYMARAAFIMDRIMSKIGLQGKSFIPMLVGFGCTVPGIMATRTLEDRRERLATMFVLPLMSCGARFPIYALLIPAFFAPAWQAPMLWIIYVVGIVLAIVLAKILRVSVLGGEPVPFILELPPYHVPTLRTVGLRILERCWMYLKKAGTVILGISIILWFLTAFPKLPEDMAKDIAAKYPVPEATEVAQADGQAETATADAAPTDAASTEAEKTEPTTADVTPADAEKAEDAKAAPADAEQAKAGEGEEEKPDPVKEAEAQQEAAIAEAALDYSYAGRIGHFIEPAMKPMGCDWKIGTAMIGAFAAKEVFVAQMGIVYKVGDVEEEAGNSALQDAMQKNYTPLTGLCIMLFCLIGTPCIVTVAVMARESGSWGWALAQWGTLTLLAWCVATLVYQIGSACSWGI